MSLSDIQLHREQGGRYLWKLNKSRTIPNIHPWKSSPLLSHTITNTQQSLPPTHTILWCFSPNSSISLHPPSSHHPQVVCSVLSSTAWINDWCSRPQVKVRKVHYWIISALLSLLPSAWLLLVYVVEALEGTLFANVLKTCVCVCVCVCVFRVYQVSRQQGCFHQIKPT